MIHPAGRASIVAFLAHAGREVTYGLRRIELVAPPARSGRLLVFGRLAGPGCIRLYAQPRGVWSVSGALPVSLARQMSAAGAGLTYDELTQTTRVVWPVGALSAFMLGHVLAHELGHHVMQHESRGPVVRSARTRDHEAYAARFATRLQKSWRARLGTP